MRGVSRLLVTLGLPVLTIAQDAHAAIQSKRGVQHKLPLISDDFVVGCIMIMFLLLFAFGALASPAPLCHPTADRQCLSSSVCREAMIGKS